MIITIHVRYIYIYIYTHTNAHTSTEAHPSTIEIRLWSSAAFSSCNPKCRIRSKSTISKLWLLQPCFVQGGLWNMAAATVSCSGRTWTKHIILIKLLNIAS